LVQGERKPVIRDDDDDDDDDNDMYSDYATGWTVGDSIPGRG
jgi:hypothetical protein